MRETTKQIIISKVKLVKGRAQMDLFEPDTK